MQFKGYAYRALLADRRITRAFNKTGLNFFLSKSYFFFTRKFSYTSIFSSLLAEQSDI